MNHISFPILTLLVSVQLGCASIQDVQYKSTHCIKAHAASAFAPRCPHFNDDYKCGYAQGYYDYSLNRKCKPPTIPPKEYWKAKYESPRGQQQIEAWYRGYEMGMLASEQDCGNCWHRLHPRGLMNCEPPLAYPMNHSVPSEDQHVVPNPSGSQRPIGPESIPIPVPQVEEDLSLFPPPSHEIQAATYVEKAKPRDVSSNGKSLLSDESTHDRPNEETTSDDEKQSTLEPGLLQGPARVGSGRKLFSPPPLP
jgi:hypothetical protein